MNDVPYENIKAVLDTFTSLDVQPTSLDIHTPPPAPPQPAPAPAEPAADNLPTPGLLLHPSRRTADGHGRARQAAGQPLRARGESPRHQSAQLHPPLIRGIGRRRFAPAMTFSATLPPPWGVPAIRGTDWVWNRRCFPAYKPINMEKAFIPPTGRRMTPCSWRGWRRGIAPLFSRCTTGSPRPFIPSP